MIRKKTDFRSEIKLIDLEVWIIHLKGVTQKSDQNKNYFEMNREVLT